MLQTISIETWLVAATLLATVYFSFRSYDLQHQSYKLQQQSLSLKSAEEYSEKLLAAKLALESALGMSIFKNEPSVFMGKMIQLTSEPANRLKILGYLNLYESLARGVNSDIYDEAIFKNARRGSFVKTFNALHGFIDWYRVEFNRPDVWSEFEKLAHKWAIGYED